MKTLEIDNRGNVNVVMTVVTMAVILYVGVIVLGKIGTLSNTIFPVQNATGWVDTTQPGAGAFVAMSNITALAGNGMMIAAIGLLILAAVGILSYFGVGFGGRGRK